jgi:hypothetical protein
MTPFLFIMADYFANLPNSGEAGKEYKDPAKLLREEAEELHRLLDSAVPAPETKPRELDILLFKFAPPMGRIESPEKK